MIAELVGWVARSKTQQLNKSLVTKGKRNEQNISKTITCYTLHLQGYSELFLYRLSQLI